MKVKVTRVLLTQVGEGSVDIYPICPAAKKTPDSANKNAAKSSSMAFILVWSPVGKPETKILVPGDLTQTKLFEGFVLSLVVMSYAS